MPNFSRIVRVGFEIVVFWSGVRKMLNPAPRYPKLGTGPSPASPYFNVLTGTDHLAKDCGRRLSGFVIRRRRACLGMPTDGGRWYESVALTKTVICYFKYCNFKTTLVCVTLRCTS